MTRNINSEYFCTQFIYKRIFLPRGLSQFGLSFSEKKSPFVDSSNLGIRLLTISTSVFYKGFSVLDLFSQVFHRAVLPESIFAFLGYKQTIMMRFGGCATPPGTFRAHEPKF